MSAEVLIQARGLGKQYRLGSPGLAPRHLRHELASLLRGVTRVEPDSEETLWALRDIDLDVRRGEILGVIGRNGSGKSTLLKILSRITPPTEGRVGIRGRVASLLEVGTGFHPELTGRENVYMNGVILGMTRKEVASKLDEIVAFAGVEKFLETPVKRYSSGMKLRLAFAVAAHLEPEILVVDEVLAVGDVAFQRKCMGRLGEISRGEGRTVLFVSHNMAAVRSLCTRGVLLSHGKLSFDGDTDTCIEKYMEFGAEILKSGDLDALRRERIDASTPAFVRSIRAVSDNYDPEGLALLDWGDPFEIEVEFEVQHPVRGASFGITFERSQGERVSVLWSGDDQFSLDLEPPRARLRIQIPRLPLAPGRYMASPFLTQGVGTPAWDVVQGVPLFEVGNSKIGAGSYLNRHWGVVQFEPGTWSLEPEGN